MPRAHARLAVFLPSLSSSFLGNTAQRRPTADGAGMVGGAPSAYGAAANMIYRRMEQSGGTINQVESCSLNALC